MRNRTCLFILFVLLMLVSSDGGRVARAAPSAPAAFSAALCHLGALLPPGQRLAVLVHLKPGAGNPAADRSGGFPTPQAVIAALQAESAAAQAGLLAELAGAQARGEAGRVLPLWINNSVLVEAGPALLAALAQRPEVAQITPDFDPDNPLVPVGGGPAAARAGEPEPNLLVIGATVLWAQGFTGQGVTVAIFDSGVDAAQPDLAARYRGGSNSWYDAYGQFATPYDSQGHGTWVSGVVLGDGTGGRSTGVAPGAQWIAAKIFPSPPMVQSLAAVHQAFQWVLDPDGDPATRDAPQVVNNSWDFSTPGCNREFQPDLLALRAAGITAVFAAGNSGPGSSTGLSPANNLAAFSVGAVDNGGVISVLSSRGPNACDAARAFPDVVAPGENIVTTMGASGYISESGTSLAAPHVSGGLALLIARHGQLSPALLEQMLVRSALDLGVAGPDAVYGNGLIMLPGAAARLQRLYLPLVYTQRRLYIPLVHTQQIDDLPRVWR